MDIKFLAKINGFLSYPNDLKLYPFVFDNLALSNDVQKLKEFFPEDYNRAYIGLKSDDGYHNDYYICYIGESNNIPRLQNIVNIGQMGEILLDLLNMYLTALWFIKDSSANINQCLVTDSVTGEVSISSKGFFYTDAKGSYESSQFKISDIKSAFSKLGVLSGLFNWVESDIISKDEVKGIKANKSTSMPYKNIPRIGRSLSFLDLARAQALLPLKISFYVVLLESLFTSTTSEVTHQVSERTALFVGGSKLEKKETYNIVKKAYGYRSKYMHGQLIKDTIEDLKTNAFQIDNIVRRLYSKVLNGEAEIFDESDTVIFDNFFRDLIFQ